jgi:hypothetical protein
LAVIPERLAIVLGLNFAANSKEILVFEFPKHFQQLRPGALSQIMQKNYIQSFYKFILFFYRIQIVKLNILLEELGGPCLLGQIFIIFPQFCHKSQISDLRQKPVFELGSDPIGVSVFCLDQEVSDRVE